MGLRGKRAGKRVREKENREKERRTETETGREAVSKL